MMGQTLGEAGGLPDVVVKVVIFPFKYIYFNYLISLFKLVLSLI